MQTTDIFPPLHVRYKLRGQIMINSYDFKMLLVCMLLFSLSTVVQSERCVLGGVPCLCSDDMALVVCKGSCIKQLDEIKMSTKFESRVQVLDVENNCLKEITDHAIARFPNLRTLKVKNQFGDICSGLKVNNAFKVISDCVVSKSTSLPLNRLMTTTLPVSKTTNQTVRQTVSTIPGPNTTHQRIVLNTRKPLLQLTTQTQQTTDVTTDGDLESTSIPLNNTKDGHRFQMDVVIALCSTSALLVISVCACFVNFCFRMGYDRTTNQFTCCVRCRKTRPTRNRTHILFPTNNSIETLSADSVELFTTSFHDKYQ